MSALDYPESIYPEQWNGVRALEPNDAGTEELTLTPERAEVVTPAVRALLADLRSLEEWEQPELEPMTNTQRWWSDDDAK